MAAASRVGWAAAAAAIWLLAAAAAPTPGRAADPVATPPAAAAGGTPTCNERYPADGPAGIDLLLGCIVGEVMGHYTGAESRPGAEPARISAIALPIAAAAVGLILLFRVIRAATTSVDRRLVAATPTAWWACPGCRSVNAAGTTACYRCGRAFEEGATEMRADGEPPAPQSFGRRDDL